MLVAPDRDVLLTVLQLKQFPKLQVIGGKDCDAVSKTPKDGETFKIGKSISVTSLHTPCHTQDSICYFLEDGNDKAVFTGDTLFIGGMREGLVIRSWTRCSQFAGCGRFFEGTAAEMNTALNKKLASLPDDTKVYVSPTTLFCYQLLLTSNSPAMSTRRRMSSSSLRSHKRSLSRSYRLLRRTTKKRKGNLPSEMKRYVTSRSP